MLPIPFIDGSSFITVTAHFLTDNFERRSFSTVEIDMRHTSQNLSEVLKNIIHDWGMDKTIVATVHDNAANITKAVKDSKEYLGESIPWFAHTLQLCINKTLDNTDVKHIINKCSNIVAYFHHSTVAANALRKAQSNLNLPEHRLVQHTKTRWNSAYDMINRLIKQRTGISAVLADRSVVAANKNVDLDLLSLGWTVMEDLTSILKPFATATHFMSSESNATISVHNPLVNSLITKCLPKIIRETLQASIF